MKKQNNILLFTKQAFNVLIVVLLCTACTDETWESIPLVKEGIPVEVDFKFATSEMDKISTRLSDDEEFQVNDLYLLIFDSNGNRKAGSQYFDGETLRGFGHTNGNQSSPTNGTLKNIQTTSGNSYIYAIANVVNNELDRDNDLKDRLDGVSDITALKNLYTTLNNDGNTGRTSPYLLMSGTFHEKSASDENKVQGKCTISTNGNIQGTLYLHRVDSHIRFNIKLGTDIKTFELKSWQVYNMPVNSYLIAQNTNYPNATYSNSGELTTRTIENNIYSFDFYMQENLKNAQNVSEMKAYKDREKEEKDSNGKNTGTYKYAEKNATFVEIKAKMNITNPSNPQNGIRTADVRYIIHLGGVESISDFKSKRNKKYTYNVTINNVNEIIVEVNAGEDASGARPGSEGDVVDSETRIYTLDAHYNCFNIGFTTEEIDDLSFIVQSPFGEDVVYSVKGKIGALENTDPNKGDWKWIKFQRTTDEKTIAKFHRDGAEVINLYQLVKDVKEYAKSQGSAKTTYWYTVFIDEYYYENPPTDRAKSQWGGDKSQYWKYFVNKDNRNFLLFLTPKYSADGESSYSTAKYMISQRSIQTYYNTENLNKSGNALGMEHVNETGIPKWGIDDSDWVDQNNGFYNTNYYFYTKNNAPKWDNFVNYSISNDFPYTYNMNAVEVAIAECLSRNRDDNGNGDIDLEELKWYLPSTNQLIKMFLGAKSLPSPLFDADKVSSVIYNDAQYHYITSDNKKVWAEEGCSFGGIDKAPQLLRCVRNLGLSNPEAVNTAVDDAYSYDSNTRIFRMSQMAERNIRPGKVSGELGNHNNFDDANRPYKAFQMAKDFINDRLKENGQITWSSIFDIDDSHNTKCKNYKEGGYSWRAPNQREFMIMFLNDINNVMFNYKYEYQYKKDTNHWPYWEWATGTKTIRHEGFSRTHWKYKTWRHFGINGDLLFLDGNFDDQNKKTTYYRTIRCVRDVD